MPIIFICNRRSIKQITQKCSEGKIELFFDAPQRREDPALEKKEGERAGGRKRVGTKRKGDGVYTIEAFGARAAKNSSPRASI